MKLFYRKYGEAGPPLIIVHGLYGMSDNWATVAKELSDKFVVYTIDQRNHGKSPHSDIHDYDSMCNDLKQFFDDNNVDKATLVGHSMGGKTVMKFAEKYPEFISAMTVVDISPKRYSKTDDAILTTDHRKIINALHNIDLKDIKSRKDADIKLSEQLKDIRLRGFLLKNLKKDNHKNFYWGLNIESISNNLEKITDKTDKVSKKGLYGFPVLFIRGLNSNYITDNDISIIREIFPYADIADIPDAGHWVHAEQPKLFIETLKNFLLE
ncbi:MAG: alpha/beta fold hydrolase [Bacteroidales bacterium]|jgi:pimeloyl-ACP methyl ester carboxylesterase|nr:alpha/beta fold hydrolase [Bacteroidales bacterium]